MSATINQLPFEIIVDPNSATPVDITSHVVSIDSCKFQGTGRIRTASIMLDALEGAFITNTNGGATPQINEFDKIQIKWQDENQITKSALFEVDTELGQKTESGITLPLELKGRERALQDMKTTAYFEFLTPFTVINLLVIMYNTNRGDEQPQVTTLYPASNPLLGAVNIYDFTSGFSYYDALMHVITRLNQPTSSGGVGDFYSLVFDDVPTADNNLVMTIKVQGSGPIAPTIMSSELDPMHSLTYRIDTKKGNQVFVRGQPNTGSVPNGFHDFSSIVEEVNHYPRYQPIGTYAQGQRVLESGTIYEAIRPVPINTPPTTIQYWRPRSFERIARSIQYSEWTNDKADTTKNSCSNPTTDFISAGFDSPAFPDGNLVVNETFYFRDFVNVRTRSVDDLETSHPAYLQFGTREGLYKGFRVLLDTRLGFLDEPFGDGQGIIYSDRFGRSFQNAMARWSGSEWIVFRSPVAPTTHDRAVDHCCVLAEGKIYEYNSLNPTVTGTQTLAIRKANVFRGASPSGPFFWNDASEYSMANDAFHHPTNIESVEGLLTPTIRANQDISDYLTDSAIKITYSFEISQVILEGIERIGNYVSTAADTIVDLFSNPISATANPTADELAAYSAMAYYDIGWWYALPFPHPLSQFSNSTPPLGSLHGLGTDPNNINLSLNGGLDIQNSTFAGDGSIGLNHDRVSDMGGPFTALAFNFQFNILQNGRPQPFKGDIPFTITIYDDISQVWRADYQYRHMGDAEDIQIPFSSFTVNRPSRNPWSIDTALINVIHTPELEIRGIFQERRVRLITWQLKTSYDDNERYMPFNLDNFISMAFGIGSFSTEGTIDGLRLVKQPFVSSGVERTRVLNPQTIEAPNTRNKRQLEAIASAEQQRASHKYEAYTYVENIRCDLTTEQSVFLEDPDIIKSADRNETDVGASDGDANTKKLVVLEENFSYNAEGKQGGALHELTLVRRLPV